MDCTLVSAYYEVPSEKAVSQYIEHAIELFTIGAPIVLFTTSACAPLFRRLRKDLLHIVEIPFNDLEVWKVYGPTWERKYGSSPYKRLYALRCAKPFFMASAAELNPFGSKTFIWCNLSCVSNRKPSDALRQAFPKFSSPKGRLVFGALKDCDPEMFGKHPDGIYGDAINSRSPHIATDVWGGSADAIKVWKSVYEHMLILHLESSRNVKNDHAIVFSTFAESPSLAQIASVVGFELFTDTTLNSNKSFEFVSERIPVGIYMLGGLGNQMFQLASSYAYARSHNSTLQVIATKTSDDRRPLYWDSVLYRWTPFLVDAFSQEMPVWHETFSTKYTTIPKPLKSGLRLCNYLQSSQYFGCDKIKNEIRKMMKPSSSALSEVQEKYAALMANRSNIVVMHARRGDYVGCKFHGALDIEYYIKASAKMLEFIKKPFFLLCSDDAEYWTDNIKNVPVLEDGNYTILGEETDVITLTLLQQFNHFVIANSSFSWWSAWLAEEPKRVIAPNRWFGCDGPPAGHYQDVYEPDWIKIDW